MTGHGNHGGTQDGRTPVLAGPGGPDSSSGADGAPVSPMTRDELIGLMTAWGWTLSDDMPGYQVWASPRTWRGRHVDEVIVPGEDWRPNVKRYMARAVGAFAAAEAGRLLDVVREVAALVAPQWRSIEYDRNALIDDIRTVLATLTENEETNDEG